MTSDYIQRLSKLNEGYFLKKLVGYKLLNYIVNYLKLFSKSFKPCLGVHTPPNLGYKEAMGLDKEQLK